MFTLLLLSSPLVCLGLGAFQMSAVDPPRSALQWLSIIWKQHCAQCQPVWNTCRRWSPWTFPRDLQWRGWTWWHQRWQEFHLEMLLSSFCYDNFTIVRPDPPVVANLKIVENRRDVHWAWSALHCWGPTLKKSIMVMMIMILILIKIMMMNNQ